MLNSQLLNGLIAEASIDEVGLWLIASTVKSELGIVDPLKLRATTLECVKALLDSGKVFAADYGDGYGSTNYRAWNTTSAETVARLEREWIALGREPNIGEIVVFVGPSLLSQGNEGP